MKYQIDQTDRPVYLQLYKQIRDDIIAENYPYQAKLPSKRTLAEETGVSTVTVEHAYALLCDEGYVEARQRSGYRVIFRKTDGFASTTETQLKHSRTHTSHDYPDFPLTIMSKTVRKVLTEHGDLSFEKSPNSGCLALRDALRRYLKRNRGITVDTEQIIIGAGSEYLYRLIIDLFGRDRTYAIESPSYKQIEQVYKASDLRYDLLPLKSEGIDSFALSATPAEILHTTPHRSFPTGVTATASKRHEYIRWSQTGDRYIIEDDYESEFSVLTKPTEPLFVLSKADRVIYVNTFSKTISPSLRLGYMILPKHLLPLFEAKLGFYSCTVPTFMQYVLAQLIESGDFERHINRTRRKLRRELSVNI